VFKRGILNGLITIIPFGGHTLKNSTHKLKVECIRDQKILKKNIISDKIKKLFPILYFFVPFYYENLNRLPHE